MAFIYLLLFLILSILIFVLATFINSCILLNKRPIRYLYNKRKNDGNYSYYYDLPYKTIDIVLALEDRNFFTHNGYDLEAIKNAFLFNFKVKKITIGGSTITQQLAKNLYLSFKQTFFRKLTEFFITLRIEKELDKTEILELYLNIIYYGNEVYGLYNAAEYYFNKRYQDLTVNQLFLLLSFLSAPTAGNPYTNPDIFLKLRNKKVKQVLWLGQDRNYAKKISSYDIDCLDPELVIHETNSYDIKMKNDKYGTIYR